MQLALCEPWKMTQKLSSAVDDTYSEFIWLEKKCARLRQRRCMGQFHYLVVLMFRQTPACRHTTTKHVDSYRTIELRRMMSTDNGRGRDKSPVNICACQIGRAPKPYVDCCERIKNFKSPIRRMLTYLHTSFL